jgi:hypothetical protein
MWSNISKRVNIEIWSSSYWVMSLRTYVSIWVQKQCTHTFLILVVPQVSSLQSFFQVVSHLVILFPSGLAQCGANKTKRINPRRYAMIKILQVIPTNGNATRTHLSYLLSFKLPPCMICSKLPCLTSLLLCTWFSHYLFVHTRRASLGCIMLVSWAYDPP